MNSLTHSLTSEPYDVTGPASVSIEHGFAECIRRMRLLAESSGSDDFYERWTREVLDKRPLIVVAAVFEGQTHTWLMEPGADREHAQDGVLHAGVSHLLRGNGETVDPGTPHRETKTHLLTKIAGDVDWLVRETTGSFIDE